MPDNTRPRTEEAAETLRSSVLVDGIVYGEAPRWHDGRLWFSDVHDDAVKTVNEHGGVEVAVRTPHPCGLGWLPDGTMLISTLGAPHLMRVGPEGATVLHDFSNRGWSLNDMVIGPDGSAYVDLYPERANPPPGEIVLVTPDGDVRTVAWGLATPNGLAITPDRSTLLVSETFAARVLAFTIRPDGSLEDRRVFADLVHRQPDGLCVDAQGAVWVGSFSTCEFVRVLEGGEVTHRVDMGPSWAVAPALGGSDGRTLYLLAADTTIEALARGESKGRIEQVRVEVPGAGWP